MARIKDVALEAGVSVGTVDRVIHGRGKVAKDVERKVKEAIKLLNYQPNLAARSLAKKANHKIAIALPEHVKDEFWIDQNKGILRALHGVKNFGFSGDVLKFDDQKNGGLLELNDLIFNGDYEALLIAPTIKSEALEIMNMCEEKGLPYVQINSLIERSENLSLGYVGQDSYKAGSLGAKLLDFGAPQGSTLALLHLEYNVENSTHLLAKEAGFKKYWAKCEMEHRAVYRRMVDLDQKKKLRIQVEKLLQEHSKIRGVFVTTSKVHLISDILIQLEREDIALVGFDLVQENIESLKKYQNLFLINQNPSLQGYYGVMRLFDYFLKNRSVKDSKYLPLGIVTLENVDNYLYMKDRDNIAVDYKNES